MGSIEKDFSVSESEEQMIETYSKNIDIQDIGLFWQLTMKTLDDLRIIGNENLILEMYVMQLTHLKSIGMPRETLENNQNVSTENLKDNLIGEKIEEKKIENNVSTQIKNQLKNTEQIKSSPIKNLSSQNKGSKIEITSFQDLITIANKEKEIELKYDLERNVKLVSFNKGKIDISFNEKLNKNFIKNLTEKLLLWTGERWIISLSKNNDAKSIYELNNQQKSIELMDFKKSKISEKIQKAFPDAKLSKLVEDNND